MNNYIEDIKIKYIRVIPDERGWLMEILRNDDVIFQEFGQIYISTAYPEVVKGWHYHKKHALFWLVEEEQGYRVLQMVLINI